MKRPIKVLIAKPGLDGHDRGAKVIANALRDAGMEVVYTGLHQTPEMIVEAAVQEDADLVSVSILSGAHMTLIPRVRELMNAAGLADVRLIAGGIIPDADAKLLLATPGVAGVFGPGTSTRDVVAFIEGLFPGRSARA
jgi:methylmalonyl-CoA mutase C-terminal domain/subunit